MGETGMTTREEVMERVAREEREWLVARLHFKAHGNWLGPDECPICLCDEADEEECE